jgi:hypothetical protein
VKKQHDKITPDRLIEASIAVLKAVAEVGAVYGSERVAYPPDLMGSNEQPKCLCDYTRWEVEEATAFLVRMGFLDKPANN